MTTVVLVWGGLLCVLLICIARWPLSPSHRLIPPCYGSNPDDRAKVVNACVNCAVAHHCLKEVTEGAGGDSK